MLFFQLDHNDNGPSPLGNIHLMTTRAKNGISKPKALVAQTILLKLTTTKEVLNGPVWRHAMKLEYDALTKDQT